MRWEWPDFASPKMTGAGNDFIVIDNRKGLIPDGRREFVARISERRLSVGADGVALGWSLRTAPTSECVTTTPTVARRTCAATAGRCIAQFAHLKRIARRRMTFESQAGLLHAEVTPTGTKLLMTDPIGAELRLGIELEKGELTVHSVNTGVPHVVVFVDDLEAVEVEKLGREIRYHRRFSPAGTNATFVSPVEPGRAAIRTYERGVEGETLACGTGAVAAGGRRRFGWAGWSRRSPSRHGVVPCTWSTCLTAGQSMMYRWRARRAWCMRAR